jgi:CubicO group peptidase (beta-lactamase class C family)
MTSALAAQKPWWTPGSAHGYHVNMQGFLIGEVVRRVTGRTYGAYLRESLAGPAAIDFTVGLDPRARRAAPSWCRARRAPRTSRSVARSPSIRRRSAG